MSDRLLQVLAAVALLFSTVGCVLSSKAPLFTATDGATPIAVATNYDAYSKDGEGWKKEDNVFRFEAAGKAYLMSDGKTTASVIFVPLGQQWFAAQYREEAQPYYYGLVRVTKAALEVAPLPCDRLQPLAPGLPGLTFASDDCTIAGSADPRLLFAALIDKLPAPGMKLVPRR